MFLSREQAKKRAAKSDSPKGKRKIQFNGTPQQVMQEAFSHFGMILCRRGILSRAKLKRIEQGQSSLEV
jgi:hypothetical protein